MTPHPSNYRSIPLNGLQSPCKDCLARRVGYHSTCEQYLDYDEKCRALREERSMAVSVESARSDAFHYAEHRTGRWRKNKRGGNK